MTRSGTRNKGSSMKQGKTGAISCRCFPRQEALLWAVLARACLVYPSKHAGWIYDNLVYLPSQMAMSFIGIPMEVGFQAHM